MTPKRNTKPLAYALCWTGLWVLLYGIYTTTELDPTQDTTYRVVGLCLAVCIGWNLGKVK